MPVLNWHHQQCANLPIPPHPCQYLLFFFFFDDSYTSKYELISDCDFDLHFPDNRF